MRGYHNRSIIFCTFPSQIRFSGNYTNSPSPSLSLAIWRSCCTVESLSQEAMRFRVYCWCELNLNGNQRHFFSRKCLFSFIIVVFWGILHTMCRILGRCSYALMQREWCNGMQFSFILLKLMYQLLITCLYSDFEYLVNRKWFYHCFIGED